MTALLVICLIVLAVTLLAAYAITRRSALEISGGSKFFWFRLNIPAGDGKRVGRLNPSAGDPAPEGRGEAPPAATQGSQLEV